MAEYEKTWIDRMTDRVGRIMVGTGRIAEKGLFGLNWAFTMLSGTATLLALGVGVDILTGSEVTGIEPPTWDQLKDWVHNNLANNPPNQ